MPEWTKTEFERFYALKVEHWGRPNTRSEVTLHYHWWPIVRWQRSDRGPRLFDLLGINAGESVVIVGSGFNGTGAGLIDLGADCIGTDISDYIQAEKDNTEEQEIRDECVAVGVDPDADSVIGPPGNVMVNPLDLWMEGGRSNPKVRGKTSILDEDMNTTGSRNKVTKALNNDPRYGVSEDVLGAITDTEALQVCDNTAQLASETGATVVHMLSPLQADATQDSALNWKTYADWRAFLDNNGFASQLIVPVVTARDQGMTLPASNPAGMVSAYAGLI